MNSAQKTHEQDVIAARGELARLKAQYMDELTIYLGLPSSAIQERCAAVLRCQQKGNAYFNYAEEFVGNNDLLGAHESALWAQGFAEDCGEILKSLPGHLDFLKNAFTAAQLPCSHSDLCPGTTAYANMERMVVKYLTSAERNSIESIIRTAGLPVYGLRTRQGNL